MYIYIYICAILEYKNSHSKAAGDSPIACFIISLSSLHCRSMPKFHTLLKLPQTGLPKLPQTGLQKLPHLKLPHTNEVTSYY